jgi:hypothetical protein
MKRTAQKELVLYGIDFLRKLVDWLNGNNALCELLWMEATSVNHHKLYATSRLLYNNREGLENYLSHKTSELSDPS